MVESLNVYLNKDIVGNLFIDATGQMLFQYSLSWLKNPNAVPISYSLPLRSEVFARKECRGFFAGILPEENKRRLVARKLGISESNDFAMLEAIGGECAGAITFIKEGESLPKHKYKHRILYEQELQEIFDLLPRQPLMAGDKGVRLSLAGAQDKIAVHIAGNIMSLPLGGEPTTHILKPDNVLFPGLVVNEAFCMKLAKKLGLPVATTEIRKLGSVHYLLVERYDRKIDKNGNISRLHQEDFCQALDIVSEKKYQSEGGPSLKDCFALLREVSSNPVIDLSKLLDAVIFNILIGNNDAHGKNFSLLYQAPEVRFAPLYDLISTAYYPELSKTMAMKIGKESDSLKIMPQHWETLAKDAELAAPMVLKRVPELANKALQSLSEVVIDHPVAIELSKLIAHRCKTFIDRS